MSRQKATDDECIAAYERFGHLGQAAAELGIAKGTLHGRLVRLGISTARVRRWSAEDDDLLRANYSHYRDTGKVLELAKLLDRTVGAVTTRAYTLGLTDPNAGEAEAWTSSREFHEYSAEDRFVVGERLLALGALDHRMDLLVLDGDPMSKARSRFTKRGAAYTPASVKAAEDRWVQRLANHQPFTGNVALVALFVRADHQRIDVDNMVKLVMDACTRAAVWQDDSQVTALAGAVELDPYRPRTILGLAPHQSTMQRGSDHWPVCGTCGEKFNPAGRHRPKYCSQKCREQRPSPTPRPRPPSPSQTTMLPTP